MGRMIMFALAMLVSIVLFRESPMQQLEQVEPPAAVIRATLHGGNSTGTDLKIFVANRDPAVMKLEALKSCGMHCQFNMSGLALTPPQTPYWFEEHTVQKGGGLSQQVHPARAVEEIMKSGITTMSMMAVDIGASYGSPECGPLFKGLDGGTKKWGGATFDVSEWPALDYGPLVKKIAEYALPSTIATHLQNACIPHDLDLLKIDIDCFDWDIAKAILDAGFRPKVFTAEITNPFPPPLHFHVGYDPNFKWNLVSKRPKEQQPLYGASLSAYSDLLRPLGYTLLNVDYYNVVYVQTKFIHLFGDIPTDDISAWHAGWFDRPERITQPDLQKYWIKFPLHYEEWMKEADVEKRLDMIVQYLHASNGATGQVIQTFSSAVMDPPQEFNSLASCTK